jgi:hypothetical protein
MRRYRDEGGEEEDGEDRMLDTDVATAIDTGDDAAGSGVVERKRRRRRRRRERGRRAVKNFE